MDIEFWNLSYTPRTWKIRAPQPTILKNVSGRFKSGELSAIMGPSGAGKSTLLNALSGLTTAGVQGDLTVKDNPSFRKSSCYITQESALQPLLTVHELMMVAASLKLPSSLSQTERRNVVRDILSTLGLSHTAGTRTERLSGGEKKRVSIAVELVNNPPVLFLDEPTSGLDNVSTRQCLTLLRRLARGGSRELSAAETPEAPEVPGQGRTLVLTIHQPSAALLDLFDTVYVLARGSCVYQGPPRQLVPFLADCHISCPRHYNPADFLMELTDTDETFVSVMSTAVDNGKLARGVDGGMVSAEREASSIASSSECSDVERQADFGHVVSGWVQFVVLLRRMVLQLSRNKVGLRIQFVHHSMCALMMGAVYYNVANDGNQFFFHMKFSIALVIFHTYTHVMVPVLVYPNDVKLFKREHFNRWYGLNSYYAALCLSRLPVQICLTTYFLSIIYYMSGLPEEWLRFSVVILNGILISLVAEGLGLSIGAVFSVTNGSAIGPMMVAPMMGLAVYGFDFAPQIPWYILALMKTSFLRSGVAGFVLAMFGFGRKTLECNEIYCHLRDPRKVLKFLDVEGVTAWSELGNLLVLLLLYRLAFWCGLRYKTMT